MIPLFDMSLLVLIYAYVLPLSIDASVIAFSYMALIWPLMCMATFLELRFNQAFKHILLSLP